MTAGVPEVPAHIRKSACNPVHRPPEHRRQKAAATSPPVRLRVRRDFHALIIFLRGELGNSMAFPQGNVSTAY